MSATQRPVLMEQVEMILNAREVVVNYPPYPHHRRCMGAFSVRSPLVEGVLHNMPGWSSLISPPFHQRQSPPTREARNSDSWAGIEASRRGPGTILDSSNVMAMLILALMPVALVPNMKTTLQICKSVRKLDLWLQGLCRPHVLSCKSRRRSRSPPH